VILFPHKNFCLGGFLKFVAMYWVVAVFHFSELWQNLFKQYTIIIQALSLFDSKNKSMSMAVNL
jgi:hypothetical protein